MSLWPPFLASSASSTMLFFSAAKAVVLTEAWARRSHGVGCPIPRENLAVAQAVGRIAADDVYAPTALPLFDNSAMDGYAFNAGEVAAARAAGQSSLRVVGCSVAGPGRPSIFKPATGQANNMQHGAGVQQQGQSHTQPITYEIMTGAPMPPGCDTVVPVELVNRGDRPYTGDNVATAQGQGTQAHEQPSGQEAAQPSGMDRDACPPGQPLGHGHHKGRQRWSTIQPVTGHQAHQYYISMQTVPVACKHVRRRGEDIEQGTIIVRRGQAIRPADIMVMASLGISQVDVEPVVRVAVICTGAEVVDSGTTTPIAAPGQSTAAPSNVLDSTRPLQPGQIHNSNGPYITARLSGPGVQVTYIGNAGDDQGAFKHMLQLASSPTTMAATTGSASGQPTAVALSGPAVAGDAPFDVIITVGGVSAGRMDYVPPVLDECGWRTLFHGVAMKPGHPMLCTVPGHAAAPAADPLDRPESAAKYAAATRPMLFGLPGNPVAVATCLEFIVLPYIHALQGQPLALPVFLPDVPGPAAVASHEGRHGQGGSAHTPGQATGGHPYRHFIRARVVPILPSDGAAAGGLAYGVQPLAKSRQGSAVVQSLTEADGWIEVLEGTVVQSLTEADGWIEVLEGTAEHGTAVGKGNAKESSVPPAAVRFWPMHASGWLHQPQAPRLYGLVLCGGESRRMGRDKANIRLGTQTLAERAIAALRPVCERVFVSLRPGQKLERQVLVDGAGTRQYSSDGRSQGTPKIRVTPVYDAHADIGPAAGLLAAHAAEPHATWAVLACDYCLVEPSTFTQLVDCYRPPAACLAHIEDGQPEPLIAIWTPAALAALARNVAAGKTGPCRTLKQVGVHLVHPVEAKWLTNVNTPEELEQASTTMNVAKPTAKAVGGPSELQPGRGHVAAAGTPTGQLVDP